MPSNLRVVASLLFAFILIFSFGCSSTKPKAESAAPPVVEVAPTPAPQPSVDEEYVTDGGAETVVSEQATVEDLPADREPVAADAYRAVADRDELERGFQRLSMDHRAVLVLHYFLDLTLDETAAVLGIPVGTVRSRLHYGMQGLRAALDADSRADRLALAASGGITR